MPPTVIQNFQSWTKHVEGVRSHALLISAALSVLTLVPLAAKTFNYHLRAYEIILSLWYVRTYAAPPSKAGTPVEPSIRPQLTYPRPPSITIMSFHLLQGKSKEPAGPFPPPGHEYRAPERWAVRSPCPALNTLANHGYLPRSGLNISSTELTHALQVGFGLSYPLALVLTHGGRVLVQQFCRLSLADLARHGLIEHDASLAHADASPHAEYAPARIDDRAAAALLAYGDEELTLRDIARARVRREQESAQKGNMLDGIHAEIARGEVALVLALFGVRRPDGELAIPTGALRTWWMNEQFPEGWAPRKNGLGLLKTMKISWQIKCAMKEEEAAERKRNT